MMHDISNARHSWGHRYLNIVTKTIFSCSFRNVRGPYS